MNESQKQLEDRLANIQADIADRALTSCLETAVLGVPRYGNRNTRQCVQVLKAVLKVNPLLTLSESSKTMGLTVADRLRIALSSNNYRLHTRLKEQFCFLLEYPDSRKALVKMLKDKDARVRLAAAKTLAGDGPSFLEYADLREGVLELLDHEQHRLFLHRMELKEQKRLPFWDREEQERIIDMEWKVQNDMRSMALKALTKKKDDPHPDFLDYPEVLKRIVQSLGDSLLSLDASNALVKLELSALSDAGTRTTILSFLTAYHPGVRYHTLSLLCVMGPEVLDYDDVKQSVLALLRDKENNIRTMATYHLSRNGSVILEHAHMREYLIALVKDGEPGFLTLWFLTEAGVPFLHYRDIQVGLMTLLKSSEDWDRPTIYTIWILWLSGSELLCYDDIREDLLAIISNRENPFLSFLGVMVLIGIGPNLQNDLEIWQLVLDHLRDEECTKLSLAAAIATGLHANPELINDSAIFDMLALLAKDENEFIRLGVVEALYGLNATVIIQHKAIRDVLVTLLNDDNSHTRYMAMKKLSSIDIDFLENDNLRQALIKQAATKFLGGSQPNNHDLAWNVLKKSGSACLQYDDIRSLLLMALKGHFYANPASEILINTTPAFLEYTDLRRGLLALLPDKENKVLPILTSVGSRLLEYEDIREGLTAMIEKSVTPDNRFNIFKKHFDLQKERRVGLEALGKVDSLSEYPEIIEAVKQTLIGRADFTEYRAIRLLSRTGHILEGDTIHPLMGSFFLPHKSRIRRAIVDGLYDTGVRCATLLLHRYKVQTTMILSHPDEDEGHALLGFILDSGYRFFLDGQAFHFQNINGLNQGDSLSRLAITYPWIVAMWRGKITRYENQKRARKRV